MRKIPVMSALLLLFAAGLHAQNMAAVVVRHTRTEPIAANDIMANIAAIEAQNGRPLNAEERKYVLETMVDSVLLIQEAEADRSISVTEQEVEQAAMGFLSQQLQLAGEVPPGFVITDKAVYLQISEQKGVDTAEFEAQVENQILVEKLIAAREATALESIPRPTQAELSTEYNARLNEFLVGDSVYFNQIFFSTQGLSLDQMRAKEDKARDVYNRLMNTPATFPELVASESEDEQSRASGGQTGPLVKGNPFATQTFGTAFIDEVFSMNVGDISEPLQSTVGFHIIQLSRKELARLLPMDDPEVAQYLAQVVLAAKFQVAFEEARGRVAASIRETATINYIGEYANW